MLDVEPVGAFGNDELLQLFVGGLERGQEVRHPVQDCVEGQASGGGDDTKQNG